MGEHVEYPIQPENINFLSPLGFKFTIKKTPHVNYFLQRITIPGLVLGSANQPTFFAFPIPWSGDLLFNDLTITFKVDEDLKNYLEIWQWMVELGFPSEFKQYRDILHRNEEYHPKVGETTTDGTLIVYSNKMQPQYEIVFEDMWPTTLSDLTFESTNPDVVHITCDVSFKFKLYKIRPLKIL